jgi:hypothetical protein
MQTANEETDFVVCHHETTNGGDDPRRLATWFCSAFWPNNVPVPQPWVSHMNPLKDYSR